MDVATRQDDEVIPAFVLDMLCVSSLRGRQLRVAIALIRYSYCRNLDYADASIYQLARATRMAHSSVSDALEKLQEMGIIWFDKGFDDPPGGVYRYTFIKANAGAACRRQP